MGKIIKLNDELSNKIAAGEVVERPASVVKELVENSIDANSSRIEIDVEEGGLSKIRILDDGEGMTREDAENAFFRHATSKIKDEQDLFKISTLGFRGEALPSIASVSRLTIETGNGEGPGTMIRYQGGKRIASSSSKSRKGTEITVLDLFFNTPARLKYMKTIHTELGNITDVINRQALAHPDISFRLTHNGRQLLFTNGNDDLLPVIAAIYGRQTARKFLPLSVKTLDYEIKGFIARPEVTRATRQYISIFINGRYIKHFPLHKAIEKGYHTLLPIGRHPLVVLHITMDPVLLDVNVHPSKLEVRLSKEEELLKACEEGIRNAFRGEQLIPQGELPKAAKPKSEQISLSLNRFSSSSETRIHAPEDQPPPPMDRKIVPPSEERKEEEDEHPVMESMVKESFPLSGLSSDVQKGTKEKELEETEIQEDWTSAEETHEARVPPMYPIGQLHGTYILAQNEQGLYIIDQHAAQERIKYEYFKEKIGEVEPYLQELLVPITLEVSQPEAAILESHSEALQDVGIFLESFGPLTYRVTSHPVWFPKGEEEETIRDILDQLFEERKIDLHQLREEAAILMSCKAAIKANRHLKEEEIFSLLETLRKSTDPFTCPHGRPIIVHYSTYDMEKMFKRIM